MSETLDLIAARGLAIELSTAGLRKPVAEIYPQDEIVKLALARGIRFTTASDAHSHAQLAKDFDALAARMKTLGVDSVCVYEGHRPVSNTVAS